MDGGGPRKILMTTDAVGGVWEYALQLGAGLAASGVETVLAAMGPPPDAQQTAAARRIPGLELVVGPYKLEWMDDPWADLEAAGEWLADLEARRGCDLVHLNGYALGSVPFRSPKVVVAHSCILSWWEAVRGGPAPAAWNRYHDRVIAGLWGADRVVAPTHWMMSRLEKHYGPLPSCEVIPNGRDPADFAPGDKGAFVLCAGRLWDEAKNVKLFTRVAGQLPWPIKVAGPRTVAGGDGTADSALPGIHLLGRLAPTELASLYARAAIYALPARYEPFGLTVLEAAFSECALVLGDIPSMRELWKDAALFVNPDDESELEAAIRLLIKLPGLAAVLGLRAGQRAREMTAARMTERYLTLYRGMQAFRLPVDNSRDRAPCVS